MGDSELMEPTTFERPEDFRDWLEQHHDSERERWVGYYKKGSGKASMTWPESVDETLCFGWVMTAKEVTRERRSPRLIEDSAAERRIAPLTRPEP